MVNLFKHNLDSEIICADCFDVFPEIDHHTVDLVIADLPYGITNKHWDTPIDLVRMWMYLWFIAKQNAPVILFGKQPFTSVLVQSQIKHFRYEIIWQKDKGTDFGRANIKPLNAHENIVIFYRNQPTYNKQLESGKPYRIVNKRHNFNDDLNYKSDNSGVWINEGTRTLKSVLYFARDNIHAGKSLHPTQKPVKLLEWLIASYSNEGDVVLDFCMGSGTTGIAARNLKRRFLGIEKDKEIFNIAHQRLMPV